MRVVEYDGNIVIDCQTKFEYEVISNNLEEIDETFNALLAERHKNHYQQPRNRSYTTEEIADFLGVNVRTVREAIQKGELKAVKVGKRFMISEDNYNKFINGQ